MKISSILTTLVAATNIVWTTTSIAPVVADVGPDAGQDVKHGVGQGVSPGAGRGVNPDAMDGAGLRAGFDTPGRVRGRSRLRPGARARPALHAVQKAGIPSHGSRASARLAARRTAGSTCPTRGFDYSTCGSHGCLCNFVGACNRHGTPTVNANTDRKQLTNFAPQGMEQFEMAANGVNTICEEDTVAILYDCNARIPLYAATVIDGNYAKAPFTRKTTWRQTNDPQLVTNPNFLANNGDYTNSNSHVHCYEDVKGGQKNWDGSIPCNRTPAKIHKGHLIAASYGRGHSKQPGVFATFTYTNAVPQIGSFNSGQWMQAEKNLSKQADICQQSAQAKSEDAKIYVVVGVIPSSFLGESRFFGPPGFGEFQGVSKINPHKGGYKISFPEIMWTAGCCIHTDGTVAAKYAFWGYNKPNPTKQKNVQQHSSPSEMFKAIQEAIEGVTFTPPTVFPNQPACN